MISYSSLYSHFLRHFFNMITFYYSVKLSSSFAAGLRWSCLITAALVSGGSALRCITSDPKTATWQEIFNLMHIIHTNKVQKTCHLKFVKQFNASVKWKHWLSLGIWLILVKDAKLKYSINKIHVFFFIIIKFNYVKQNTHQLQPCSLIFQSTYKYTFIMPNLINFVQSSGYFYFCTVDAM